MISFKHAKTSNLLNEVFKKTKAFGKLVSGGACKHQGVIEIDGPSKKN